jgi:hypothetical protein
VGTSLKALERMALTEKVRVIQLAVKWLKRVISWLVGLVFVIALRPQTPKHIRGG